MLLFQGRSCLERCRSRSNRKLLNLKVLLNLVIYETSSINEVRRNFAWGKCESVGRASRFSRDPLEAVLVDLQRLDLRFESSAGNAQSGSGSCRPGHPPIA